MSHVFLLRMIDEQKSLNFIHFKSQITKHKMIKIEFVIVIFKYEYPIMWFDPLKRLSYGQIRFENNSLFTMMRRMKSRSIQNER